ncbi:iron complex outermembrane receptor protein [Pseudoduganella lurida]|uniref:Iron complex outermembrane receptor protein n=1 Tax=Pseudoduganella lurida TaxID=1036180 RepID=A0A562RNJ2_9BURK|nr:TonB-dependent receptor plug domain-containing protein [Pseudoduganella lurida]TWI69990.1 iron complex outermembrane receptor protein [Pseudoduganella lurida]
MRLTTKRVPIAAACMTLLFAQASAAAAPQLQDDIAELSLEQLSDIVITSVSRQEEKLASAAASVFIISATDIRRSGARTIPEALRLAPNLQVARVDSRSYAISARGFNDVYSNKLLVMIDGRSLYTPLYSGVFWDSQDVVMEDVERIEVISGPGATIWGANAVNGVINVITRSAKDTQGGLLAVAAGSRERDGTVRYGGTLPNGGHYRAYARYAGADDSDRGAGDTRAGTAQTSFSRRQAGFRADWERAGGGLTLSGDVYDSDLAQAGGRPMLVSGANLVTRLTRRLPDDASLRLQLVLDHVERNQPGAIDERLDIVELEAQHSLRLGERHNVTWGGTYRYARDQLSYGRTFAFLPPDLTMHWASLFAQDEVALAPGLRLTVGAKMEHNNYTGAEYLPSVRLAWAPQGAGDGTNDGTGEEAAGTGNSGINGRYTVNQLFWTSLSRTVRAPSRIDRDLYTPVQPIPVRGVPRYAFGGGPDFQSETARVAELGYRIQPAPAWTYSATLFFADYERLRTREPNPNGPAYSGLVENRNMAYGRSRGVEMWARWQVLDSWRLNAGLVIQRVNTALRPGSQDTGAAFGVATSDPGKYWQLRSSHDLPANMQLDWTLRYVGSLPRPAVPSYRELDLQWLWRARPNIDVALIGQNLLHGSHAEFGTATGRSVFERSAVLKLTVRF